MTAFHFVAAWEKSNAGDSALLVLLAIAEAADKTGVVTIEQRAIAARARVHVSTVGRAIRILNDIGELRTIVPASGRRPARYFINVPLGDAIGKQDTISARRATGDAASGSPPPLPHVAAEGMLPPDDAEQAPGRGGGTDDIPAGPHRHVEPGGGKALSGAAVTTGLQTGPEGARSEPPSAPPDAGGGALYQSTRMSEVRSSMVAPRAVPSHLPPHEVGQILAALGVKPDHRGPLFWWRSEHKRDLGDVLALMGKTSAEVVQEIQDRGIRADTMISFADLPKIME